MASSNVSNSSPEFIASYEKAAADAKRFAALPPRSAPIMSQEAVGRAAQSLSQRASPSNQSVTSKASKRKGKRARPGVSPSNANVSSSGSVHSSVLDTSAKSAGRKPSAPAAATAAAAAAPSGPSFASQMADVFRGRQGDAASRLGNIEAGGRGVLGGFGEIASKGASVAAGYMGGGDFAGQGWKRGAAVGVRGVLGLAALDFANPMGLGWGD